MILSDSQISLAVILTLAVALIAPVIGGWMKVLEVRSGGKAAIETRRYEYFQHQMNQLIEWRHQGNSGNDVSTRLISLIVSIDDAEMHRVFNMGLGMLVVVPAKQAAQVKDGVRVGEIVAGEQKVIIQ